jgi:hypothetical protein
MVPEIVGRLSKLSAAVFTPVHPYWFAIVIVDPLSETVKFVFGAAPNPMEVPL